MRVFMELTPECDKTAQLFAQGYEKKEIAEIKCRSFYTINNQINTAFEILKIRNGRELTIKYFERITGRDLREQGRSLLSLILLCIFFVGFTQDLNARVRPRVRRVQPVRVVAVREY